MRCYTSTASSLDGLRDKAEVILFHLSRAVSRAWLQSCHPKDHSTREPASLYNE